MEIKGYMNRRGGYEKLEGSGCRRRKTGSNDVAEAAAEPPSSGRKRRSSWKMKLTPSLKFNKVVNLCEAKKFCVGLRDAYVDFMINIGDRLGGCGGAVEDPFGIWKNLKEYDEKMIVETYKSLDIDHA